MSESIKVRAQRQAHCKDCSLSGLCLPLSLNMQDMDALDDIVKRGRPLKKGETLFRQGDVFSSVFAVRSGALRTFSVTDGGEEQITGFHLPSELVGLSGMDTESYPVTAQALETTSVCEIPFERLDELSVLLPQLRSKPPEMRRFRRKDGSLFDMERTATMVSLGERDIIMSVSHDVSERRHTRLMEFLHETTLDIVGHLNQSELLQAIITRAVELVVIAPCSTRLAANWSWSPWLESMPLNSKTRRGRVPVWRPRYWQAARQWWSTITATGLTDYQAHYSTASPP